MKRAAYGPCLLALARALPAGALGDADGCQAARSKEAGKYTFCRQKPRGRRIRDKPMARSLQRAIELMCRILEVKKVKTMKRKVRLFYNLEGLAIAAATLTVALPIWADVPAPPVNQFMFMPDVWLGDQQEAFCLACHSAGVPPLSGPSPHHASQDAQNRHCTICHGSVVSNYDDGHYIPTYPPSLVTPYPGGGEGSPVNSRGNGAGGCKYCHDDALSPPPIRTNEQLHHDTALYTPDKCGWCHDDSLPGPGQWGQIRRCENCHGPASLHNIQADSPKAGNIGTIVVGGELAGYGHVGRDAGPGDSDCWGCHGFLTEATATAPAASGPSGPMPVAGSTFTEADCRGCHTSGVPNRHHLLYGQGPIPAGSVVPYPDSDGNGSPDSTYVCLSCHGYNFTVERDCTQCHSPTNPHGSVCWLPEECDDGIACTNDVCDQTTHTCMHTPDNSQCPDDGLFCNGQESCDPVQGCVSTGPVDCSDGIACTSDTCDAANDRCVNSPDNSRCANDGLFCNGQEICDPLRGCVSTGNPCPTGTTCYEATDICIPVTGKVTICHIPPGDPGKAKTLSIGAGSVFDHLAHGDTLGPCPN